jgi:hypothetical protein
MFLGSKALPARKANLTAICEPTVWTILDPRRLSRLALCTGGGLFCCSPTAWEFPGSILDPKLRIPSILWLSLVRKSECRVYLKLCYRLILPRPSQFIVHESHYFAERSIQKVCSVGTNQELMELCALKKLLWGHAVAKVREAVSASRTVT